MIRNNHSLAGLLAIVICSLSSFANPVPDPMPDPLADPGSSQNRLRIRLPWDVVSERHYSDDAGCYERQLWYKGNAILFITCPGDKKNTAAGAHSGDSPFIAREFLTKREGTEGKDEHGNWWKYVKLDNYIIGYANVTDEQKARFDRAMKSIKLKKGDLVSPDELY